MQHMFLSAEYNFCHPATDVSALEETCSSDPNQGSGLIIFYQLVDS